MRLHDLQAGFHSNIVIPPLIAELFEFGNRKENLGEWLSGAFECVSSGSWKCDQYFAAEPDRATQFAVFGQASPSYLYGYWLYQGPSLENAPIVCLAQERAESTVLANTTHDFFALLTLGYEVLPHYWEGWEEDVVVTEPLLRYRQWVDQTYHIAVPSDGRALIAQARAKLPDLSAWLLSQ